MNKESPVDNPYPKTTETFLSKPENIVTLHFSPRIVKKEGGDREGCTVNIKEVNQSEKLGNSSQEQQKVMECQESSKLFELNPKESKGESTRIQCINTELYDLK